MLRTIAVTCSDGEKPERWIKKIDKENIIHEGFRDEQSLLPTDSRVFQGYRILQEFFSFPEKFLFISINNLKSVFNTLNNADTNKDDLDNRELKYFELTFLFDALYPDLVNNINEQNILINCVPIINLFNKSIDRIKITPKNHEYHMVVDRTKPLNYEVFCINKVVGYYLDNLNQGKEFRPLFQTFTEDYANYGLYYSTRRETRNLSNELQKQGFRSEYIGSETFISLVDQSNTPYSDTLKVISVEILCSNRDLPRLLPIGSYNDLSLMVSAPINSIKMLKRPSKPRFPLADGANIWKVINQLGFNYQSFMQMNEIEGATALQEMLSVYVEEGSFYNKQIKSIRDVKITPSYCRIPVSGPLLYGRAININIVFDETGFSGVSPYLFGSVLEQFFRRHVSINAMTNTIISSLQRGLIGEWGPKIGSRTIV